MEKDSVWIYQMLKKYAKFADNKSFVSIVHAQKLLHTNKQTLLVLHYPLHKKLQDGIKTNQYNLHLIHKFKVTLPSTSLTLSQLLTELTQGDLTDLNESRHQELVSHYQHITDELYIPAPYKKDRHTVKMTHSQSWRIKAKRF